MTTKRMMRWVIVLFLLAALPGLTVALAQDQEPAKQLPVVPQPFQRQTVEPESFQVDEDYPYPCEGMVVSDIIDGSQLQFHVADVPSPPAPHHLFYYADYGFAFRIPVDTEFSYELTAELGIGYPAYPELINGGGYDFQLYKNRSLIDFWGRDLEEGKPIRQMLTYNLEAGIYCIFIGPVIGNGADVVGVDLESIVYAKFPPVSLNDRYDVAKDKPLMVNEPGVLANDLIANGNQSVFYLTSDHHIHELEWNGYYFVDVDITQAAGALLASGNSLTSTSRGGVWWVYYLDELRRINEVAFYDGIWHHFIVTDHFGGPLAAEGSPLISTTVNGFSRVYYLAAHEDGLHVHELALLPGGQWSHRDVTADAGAAPVAPGSVLSVTTCTNGDPRVYYLTVDQHVHELAWRSMTNVWYHSDVTLDAGSLLAQVGGGISAITFNNMVRVYYLGFDQQVHELAWYEGIWHHYIVTDHAAAPLAAIGSPIGATTVGKNNDPRVYYFGVNQHVYELAFEVNQWHYLDITEVTGAISFPPSAGSPLSVVASKFDSRVYYMSEYSTIPNNRHAIIELASTADQWIKNAIRPAGDPYPVSAAVVSPLAPTTINGFPLEAKLITDVANGTLIFDKNGAFVYTPNRGFTGIDSFTYVATDYYLDTAINTVTLDVTNECATSSANVVENNCFSQRKAYWRFLTDGRGSFTASPENVFAGKYSAQIEIVVPSSRDQLHQAGITLAPNTMYRLSFAAYSNNGRDMTLGLRKHNPESANVIYGLRDYRIDLETYWRWYTITFKTPNYVRMDDGQLRFDFAPFDVAGTVYHIDRVLLQPVN